MTEPKYKVGDKLAFRCGSTPGYWEVAEIEKITPSGRMKCGRWELNPDLSLRGRSGMWHAPWKAEPVTDEILAEIRRAKNLRFVQNVKWKEMPDYLLNKIVTIIKTFNTP